MSVQLLNLVQKRLLRGVCSDRAQASQRALDYLSQNKHLSIPSEKGPCIWNFGFGANINPWKLEQKRNIHPIGKKLRGKLTCWRLLFDHKGGFGNVVNVSTESDASNIETFEPFINTETNEYEVHGILLKLTHDDFIKLAHMEHEYEIHQVHIQIYAEDVVGNECNETTALVFKSPIHFRSKRSDLLPTSRYIEIIQKGAKQMKIKQEYCKWLSQIKGIDGQARGAEYYDLRK